MDSQASAKDFVFKVPKRSFAESNSSSSEEKQYLQTDDGTISRKKTTVEVEFAKRQAAAQMFVSTLPPESELPTVDPYIPQGLSGAVFCGPVLTDLDSIAGAIAAAELYGGVAARASEINAETTYALRVFGAIKPRPIESVLKSFPSSSVCLIDHQQTSQLNKAIPVNRIVGVIDRHALQNSTIVTDMPIYIDIRPWGSISTIIAHSFLTLNRRPCKSTAGMLLCAILSATLNLQGPTTTEWDRLMVAVLVELAGVEDVQYLAAQQFKAKSSELAGMSASALCNGDQKVFTFKTAQFEGSVGFAVIETVDDAVIMNKTSELLVALNEDKESKGLSVLFLAVVNIVALKTSLLLCGPNEKSLAVKSFSSGVMSSRGEYHNHVMDLGELVSRKTNFIPAISAAIKKGWKPE